jgi:hypothetical protein
MRAMRDLARDLYAEVAAALGPFVVLLGQDGADEADDGGAVGEGADHVGRRRISRLSRSEGLLDQIWRQTFGEATGWHPPVSNTCSMKARWLALW